MAGDGDGGGDREPSSLRAPEKSSRRQGERKCRPEGEGCHRGGETVVEDGRADAEKDGRGEKNRIDTRRSAGRPPEERDRLVRSDADEDSRDSRTHKELTESSREKQARRGREHEPGECFRRQTGARRWSGAGLLPDDSIR